MAEASQSVNEFYDMLNAALPTLPKRMRQCAQYFIDNKDIIAISTVKDIADAAQLQPSAVMRFTQLVGFSGFTELQELFRRELRNGVPDYQARLQKLKASGEQSPTALFADFVEAGHQSLELLAQEIDENNIEAAVDILAAAKRVHIIGFKRAFPVVVYLTYAFDRLGVENISHAHFDKIDPNISFEEGDAVIGISFPPYAPEIVQAIDRANDANCPMVIMSDHSESPINRPGSCFLKVEDVDVGYFRPLSAPMTLAISLAVSVGAKKSQKMK